MILRKNVCVFNFVYWQNPTEDFNAFCFNNYRLTNVESPDDEGVVGLQETVETELK